MSDAGDMFREQRRGIRDYLSEVIADAVTADAVVLLESTPLDEHNNALEVKIHIHGDLPPRVIAGALRELADQFEEQDAASN